MKYRHFHSTTAFQQSPFLDKATRNPRNLKIISNDNFEFKKLQKRNFVSKRLKWYYAGPHRKIQRFAAVPRYNLQVRLDSYDQFVRGNIYLKSMNLDEQSIVGSFFASFSILKECQRIVSITHHLHFEFISTLFSKLCVCNKCWTWTSAKNEPKFKTYQESKSGWKSS